MLRSLQGVGTFSPQGAAAPAPHLRTPRTGFQTFSLREENVAVASMDGDAA